MNIEGQMAALRREIKKLQQEITEVRKTTAIGKHVEHHYHYSNYRPWYSYGNYTLGVTNEAATNQLRSGLHYTNTNDWTTAIGDEGPYTVGGSTN